MNTLRTKRDHKAALVFQKVKVSAHCEGSPENDYSRLLTSFASSFLFKQMRLTKSSMKRVVANTVSKQQKEDYH